MNNFILYIYTNGIYPTELIMYILILAAFAIAMFAQFRVTQTYQKYKRIASQTQLTGAQVAEKILEANGIHDVDVVQGPDRELADFYDPKNKIVNLSSQNYNTNSIAALAVAAHEVGHAIQHATNYNFIAIRNSLLPMTIVASKLSMVLLMIGLMMFGNGVGTTMLWAGIISYGIIGLFQFVTLPVEFDASKRALENLQHLNILTTDEVGHSKKMLNAAAFTYVAAFLGTILTIIRFVLIAMGSSRNNRD